MASTAQYASAVQNASAQVTAANSNRDGTGTIVSVMTAGSNGTRIDDITVTATGTTTAGVVRLFIYDGANTRLWKELLVQANTPSATNAVWSTSLFDLGLVLESAWQLRASTHNAETFNIIVTRAGDF